MRHNRLGRTSSARGSTLRALGLVLPLALLAGLCDARTFTVIDTTTGEPLAGAEVHLVARGTLPGIGHPAEFTAGEWFIQTNAKGEAGLSSWLANRAVVSSLTRPGYAHTDTVREHDHRRSPGAPRDVLFLTPRADVAYEAVRYRYHVSAIAVETNRGPAGMRPLQTVALLYGEARRDATGAREREVLRQFCRFAPALAEQAAAGWPEIGQLPDLRQRAQSLIDDCR